MISDVILAIWIGYLDISYFILQGGICNIRCLL